MTFVCNAGPVIALAKVDHLRLLAELADDVLIPETVHHEVMAKPGLESSRIRDAVHSFISVKQPPDVLRPDIQEAVQCLDAESGRLLRWLVICRRR